MVDGESCVTWIRVVVNLLPEEEIVMRRTVNWGICGCGEIAVRMARAINATQGCQIRAVAAREHRRAAAFAHTHNAENAYGNYDDLFRDPGVHVVYIATIHPGHFPLVSQALERGKAVVCEKPLVMTGDQARVLTDLSRRTGRLLIEAMWIRFQPAVLELHDLIAEGLLGTINQVRCDFSVGAGEGYDPAGRMLNPSLGGGAMLDLGIYPLAMAQDFLGSIAEMTSIAELGATGVDENHAFITRHSGGGLGIGSVGTRGVGTLALEIVGSKSKATAACSWPPTEITITQGWEREAKIILRDESGVDPFVHTVAEAVRCLHAGLIESPRMTHSHSVELATFLETAWRKAGIEYRVDDLRSTPAPIRVREDSLSKHYSDDAK